MATLILYSRPGCHLCEDLEAKLRAIAADSLPFDLEIRDITEREAWMEAYQFEVPVLMVKATDGTGDRPLPRPAPRAAAVQIEQMLRPALGRN
ncbi:MAG: glutaredoxin family protein [Cyanobacteria bacterium]|nr:glutaredoxin family protein [Cyanobacteriota bacterium]